MPPLSYNTCVETTLNTTITKNSTFVIFLLVLGILLGGCSIVSTNSGNQSNTNITNQYDPPQVIGTITSNEIKESSGIAASRCNENVYWTHNDSSDSGDDNFIFALNRKGEKLGTWQVTGAANFDWEDIAALKDRSGSCYLFIGDIGNNVRARDVFVVYKVKEPKVADSDNGSTIRNPLKTELADKIEFEYPDMRRDSEALMVEPFSGEIYILSKRFSGSSGIYKLNEDYSLTRKNKLKKIGEFKVPTIPTGMVTGGDISPDGRRVVVCDYFNAYEIVLPDNEKDFDAIWKQEPLPITLGERKQGEAVCYSADGRSILATSEKKNSPLIEVRKK